MSRLNLLLFAALLSVGISSCKMSSISVNVMRPGDITLPAHFNKIAVLNRSLPAKNKQLGNIVEGILTGEGILMDRQGSKEAIYGISSIMMKSPRFEVVQPAGVELRGTGTGSFPSPLNWADVEKICNENGADALLLLEAFDSNSRVAMSHNDKKVKQQDGTYTTRQEYDADMKMTVTSGWRLYDPKHKTIVDEYRGNDFLHFHGRGWDEHAATSNLPPKRDAVNKTGYYAGQQYGYRISPMPIRVTRKYYKKGSPDMEKAARLAVANNWKGAAKLWKPMAERSANEKLAGNAAYNMAVASEVEGKLEIALMWAKKSYVDYGNKKARSYISIIERRIADQKRLKDQFEGVNDERIDP
jgi:uncharacterized protein DUF6340